MNPIEHLREEHRQIARVLTLLDDAIERSRAGTQFNPSLLRRAAEFFVRPVARAHEAKENLLYEAMRKARLPLRDALLDRVAGAHAIGQENALDWRRAAEALLDGEANPEEVLDIVGSAIRMHRDHTREEETVIFPMAQRLLAPAVLDALRSRFAVIEGTHGSIREAADVLEQAFTPYIAPIAARSRR